MPAADLAHNLRLAPAGRRGATDLSAIALYVNGKNTLRPSARFIRFLINMTDGAFITSTHLPITALYALVEDHLGDRFEHPAPTTNR